MFVIRPADMFVFLTIRPTVPGTPNVPTSKIPTSASNLDCKIGINSAFPCIPSRLCSQGVIPLSAAIFLSKVVEVVLPLVPVIPNTSFSDLKISIISVNSKMGLLILLYNSESLGKLAGGIT